MPINPAIAMGFRPPEIQSPLVAYGQVANIQQAQAQNELARLKMDELRRSQTDELALNEAYRAALGSDGTIDMNRLRAAIATGGQGAKLPAIEKAFSELQTAKATRDKTEADVIKERMALSRQGLEGVQTPEQYIAWHEANHRDPVLAKYFADRGITKEAARARIDEALKTPEGFQNLLRESKLGAEKAMERHYEKRTEGNEEVTLSMPKHGEGRAVEVKGSRTKVGMTEYQREQLAIQRKRLEQRGVSGLNEEEQGLLADAMLDDRLAPGQVNSRNAKIIVGVLRVDPTADLKGMDLDAIEKKSAARTSGTINANMQVAAGEAREMLPIVKTLSSKVDRTRFPTINAIQNAVDKGTGDENIVALNAAINAVVNSYSRAINPRGTPTVSDKNHAREIINSAYSKGQLDSIMGVMDQEMSAAQKGVEKARPSLRGKPAAAAPGAPASAATMSDDDLLKSLGIPKK